MKILFLAGSYRLKGNTAHILQLIEERMRAVAGEKGIDIEFETVFPGHLDLKFCRGCRVCFDKGEDCCPLKDDIVHIRQKMIEADGIIMASPVYAEDVNGIIKNLIDRMAFLNHRPAFGGKSAYAVTTSGIGSSNHPMKTMTRALSCWGYKITGKSKFRTGALMDDSSIKAKYQKKIDLVVRDMLGDIKTSGEFNPSFSSLLFFRVQQKYWFKHEESRDTIDYAYWKDKGWLKKDCSYYIDNKAGWLKKRLAGLLGDIIAVFFV